MKLLFVNPIEHDGELLQCIDEYNIETEVEYWKSSTAYFVLGANPPFHVMEGFTNRLWGMKGLDKIYSQADERVIYFDNKRMILKAWNVRQTVNKEDIASLPVWVKLHKLDLKFWSIQGLSKIGSLLRHPIVADKVTTDKSMLKYARTLGEMKLNRSFPESITFIDEKGLMIEQPMEFEYRPLKYGKCHMFSHLTEECRKNGVRRDWRRKVVPKTRKEQVSVE
ncbi:hypothetical protein Cgig2_006241 [Carnegiea gigantea]|uniref:DUF4283 domain-containing protein n=1 Tax=Carnegiea gigantea TaxID=171969 RepID=A0A9Q1JGC7_9CARY|nr:hypothetical protein Cgig2_006241 [Carnegiea gigantea]